MKKQKRLSNRSRIIIVTLVGLAILGGAFFLYRNVLNNADTSPTTADGQPVNLEPASEEEKAQTEATKDAIVKRDEALTQNNDTKPTATVVITEVTQTSARAYVSGVFEEGGTCQATATLNGVVATATSEAFKNVSYTQCAPMTWNKTISPGSWSVQLTYTSPTSQGSQTKIFEVK
ncbi:MAG: hypothetical protein QG553_334 [Patescibacteria group bacterium]|nr:hypothetical protein [Patescibacteria group bacterium]